MKSYLCVSCGLIFENDASVEIKCPRCGALGDKIEPYDGELIDNEIDSIIDSIIEESTAINKSNIININEGENFVHISKDNKLITKNDSKCINCGKCKKICENNANIMYNLKNSKNPICTLCGECVLNCPNQALSFKEDYKIVKEIIDKNEKIVAAIISPAVKAYFNKKYNFSIEEIEKKIVGILKKIGFDYVFDGAFGNDLYVLEETAELIDNMTNKKNNPLFTSSCPTWVKYCQIYYPELLNNISKCKNPDIMHGTIIKDYFCRNKGFDKSKIVVVDITTCTSIIDDITSNDIDYIMNVQELEKLIDEEEIKMELIENKEYDQIVGEGSSAGQLFGVLGGMSESIIRTLYRIMTNKVIEKENIVFENLRNINGIKEVAIIINKITVKIAVVEGMKNLEHILRNNYYKNFHLIEIMNCKGGCIGGSGQNIIKDYPLEEKRQFIYDLDKQKSVKCAHDNKEIKELYKEFLGKPFDNKNDFLHNELYENMGYLTKM